MPKLAIYVPKKQMREIDRWRKKINFSQVFMQALSQEIAERTRTIDAQESDVAAAAEFYRRKLADHSGPLVEFGFDVGSRQVIDCRLEPDAILSLLRIESPDRANEDQLALLKESLAPAEPRIEEFCSTHGYDDRSYPNWRLAVYSGYLKGIAAAWKRVCERIKAD